MKRERSKWLALSLGVMLLGAGPVLAEDAAPLMREAPADAEVYFLEPADHAVVPPSFKVVFGLRNMGVAPAGTDRPNTGHHHLLIDSPEGLDFTQPLPATDQVRHFGGGQTEAVIELPPGKHTLQLVMGNFVHIPHATPVVSNTITVTVE
ncbi:MAG: DUF4399 domain-containing protein [Pseudomonadota bacterium]